jgi:hypothetical protein
MKTVVAALFALSMVSCVPNGSWQPRTCLKSERPPETARVFGVSPDEAFRNLRVALVSEGYELKTQDLVTGYLRATLEKNHCRDPGPWALSPAEGGSFCDLDWPVFQWGEVEAFVDPVASGRSRVRLNIDNWYRFVSGEEVSDVCPEDYDELFESVEFF